MSSNTFFSQICKEEKLVQGINSIKASFEEKLRRPRRIQRRRGYKDKGSLLDHSIKARKSEYDKDYTGFYRQEILELRQELVQRDIIFLREYLHGDRLLPDTLLIQFKIKKKGTEENGKTEYEDKLRKEITEKQRIVGTIDYQEREYRKDLRELKEKDRERRIRIETTGSKRVNLLTERNTTILKMKE